MMWSRELARRQCGGFHAVEDQTVAPQPSWGVPEFTAVICVDLHGVELLDRALEVVDTLAGLWKGPLSNVITAMATCSASPLMAMKWLSWAHVVVRSPNPASGATGPDSVRLALLGSRGCGERGLAEEYGTDAILTLDRRDFRAVLPLTEHKAFRVLPDAL